MSGRTPVLGLILQYLQDYADIRVENENWLKLDGLFHPDTGHDHDGVDSPLINEINFRNIYERLRRIEEFLDQLENRVIRNELFMQQFYQQFLIHNHGGVTTLFRETFSDYDRTDLERTTAVVSPTLRYLHLPQNFERNKKYYWVSRVFELEPDPWPAMTRLENDTNRASVRVVMGGDQGRVVPYLAIGNRQARNPLKFDKATNLYVGARAGTLKGERKVNEYTTSLHTFVGKRVGNFENPNLAWHHYDKEFPRLYRYNPRSVWHLDKKGCREFNQQEYNKLAAATNRVLSETENIVSGDPNERPTPFYEENSLTMDARPLYHGDNVLSWRQEDNSFYWFDAIEGTFDAVDREDLGPIYDEDLIGVAANEEGDDLYVLKSVARRVESPAGHFRLMHQLVRWRRRDGEFDEGPWWSAGTFRAYAWYPRMIVPTHLEILDTKIAVITHLSYQEHSYSGIPLINYYHDTPSYQWFPFINIYGDAYRSLRFVTFAAFNPGILGTVALMPKEGEWTVNGNAKFIGGAYDPNSSWGTMPEDELDRFEGGNDNVYLGRSGEELIFYQSFVPYNGEEIIANRLYEDDQWLQNHQDKSWHGLVRYNITTGRKEFVRGDMPFRVNSSGVIDEDMAYLADGIELIKQWVIDEGPAEGSAQAAANTSNRIRKLIATVNNRPPVGKKVLNSFWAPRHANGVALADRISKRDLAINPIQVNINTGVHVRVSTDGRVSVDSEVEVSVQSPKAIKHSRGHTRVGGKKITGRKAIRPRSKDKDERKARKWSQGMQDGFKASHLFRFVIGDVEEGDVITVHYNGHAVGDRAFQPGQQYGNDKDFEAYIYESSRDWRIIRPAYAPEVGPWEFRIRETASAPLGRILWVLIRSRLPTNAKKRIASKVYTDYCFVTVKRQATEYEYEWNDLPAGDEAALMLEMSSAAVGAEVVHDSVVPTRTEHPLQVDSLTAEINMARQGGRKA